jgi:hypothetical protein
MNTKLIAGGCAIAALATPGSAMARGGGVDTPPTSVGPACATIEAKNSGVIDQIGSRRPITVDFQVTNCSTDRTTTVRTTLVPTVNTIRSLDPFVADTCVGAPYSAQQLTLKPRESRSISASAQVPYCGVSPWGVNGYDVDYEATATDATDGTVLASTTSVVQHRGGS